MPNQDIPRDTLLKLLRTLPAGGGGAPGPARVPPELLLALLTSGAQEALRNAGRGWQPNQDVQVRTGGRQPLTLEHAAFKQIYIMVNTALLLQRCSELGRGNENGNPLEMANTVVYSLVRLWAGHYDYCPFDLWRHRRLCDAAARGAYGTEWLPLRERRLAVAIAAFFERSTVAQVLTEEEGARSVAGLVYEQFISKRPLDLLANLFFRCQCLLAPQVWQSPLEGCGVLPDLFAESLLQPVLWHTFGVQARTVRRRWRLRRPPGQRPQYWQWSQRVADLAKLLIPYLEGESSNLQHPFHPDETAFPDPQAEQPGMGTPGEVPQASEPIGNPFTSGADDRPAVPLSSQGGTTAGTGAGRAIDCRNLAAYYRQQAGELAVEANGRQDGPTREPELLAVGFMNDERASILALATEQIAWFKTRIRNVDGQDEFCFYKQTDPLLVPAGDEESTSASVPHLLLLVDSSSSMGFNPRAAEPAARGKFDTVLRACYGIFNHIERNGLGEHVQVACINFSGATLTSGWHPVDQMSPVETVLLKYQGGGTTISPQAILQAFESRPAPFLAVCITDGCISNVAPAAAELRKVVEAGCEFALLHVGNPNNFTKAVQEMGCTVHVVQRAADLVGLTLGMARSRYAGSGA